MHSLDLRKTHTYVGTCSHLDEWEHIGTLDVLSSRRMELPETVRDSLSDPQWHAYHVMVESSAARETVKQALFDHFTSQGCSHDYDCCGCRSFYAESIVRLCQEGAVSLWKVQVSSSCNY